MRRGAGRGGEILDANDAVRWALSGLPTVGFTLLILELRDAMGWSWWVALALAAFGGMISGGAIALATRLRHAAIAKRAQHRDACT